MHTGTVYLTALPRFASISELCKDLKWREVNVHRGKQPWKSGWKDMLNVASPTNMLWSQSGFVHFRVLDSLEISAPKKIQKVMFV